MTDIFIAMHTFLSRLGLPVYPENGVPKDAVFPYLTWDPVQTAWDTDTATQVRIWDRSEAYRRIAGIADHLAALIGEGTTIRAGQSGYISLYQGTPWCQTQPMQDTDIKVLYINIGISTMIPEGA